MNQNDLWARFPQRFKTGADALLARRAAEGGRRQTRADFRRQSRNGHGAELGVVGVDDDAELRLWRAGRQRAQGARQHRLAGEKAILLGHVAAEAMAAPGGDDQNGDIGSTDCHAESSAIGVGARQTWAPRFAQFSQIGYIAGDVS